MLCLLRSSACYVRHFRHKPLFTLRAIGGGRTPEGDWTIYNDVWGTRKPDTQCLYVNSITSWYVDSKQSGGGVKSYPNTSVIPNTPLEQMQSATFTYNTSSAPTSSGDWWDWTSDIWSANGDDEIMIFTSYYPTAGGWGTKVSTNVTIGGILYKEVWQANPGWNVIQLIPATQSNSGTVDALAVWNWCAFGRSPDQYRLRSDAVRHRDHID